MTPRGIRNNNWGNIRLTGINWHGEALPQERTAEQRAEVEFEVFRTPVWGIRAMAINLRHYWRDDGLRTLEQIVGKWAPKSENDTDKYVDRVARHMGLDRSSALNLDDADVLRSLVHGMVKVELGDDYVPADADAVIRDGVLRALDPSSTRAVQTPAERRKSSLRRSAGKFAGGVSAGITLMVALGMIDQDQADALSGAGDTLLTDANIEAALLVLGMVWGAIETALSVLSPEKQV